MPVARGWGSGGLQVTLAVAGTGDVVKVIDQGDEEDVNAVNLRRLIRGAVGCSASADTREATVIQTRHRIAEDRLGPEHILVVQVPQSEPLRPVERSVAECVRRHGEADYARMWVGMYEDLVTGGVVNAAAGYPVMVQDRYLMAPSPIPRWDVPRLNNANHLSIFSHGRDKKIYAVPPHTKVVPLTFEDVPFEVEYTEGARCRLCGSDDTFLVQTRDGDYLCSDVEWCARVRDNDVDAAEHRTIAPLAWLPDPSRRVRATATELMGRAALQNSARHVQTAPGEEWALKVSGLGKVFAAHRGSSEVHAVTNVGFDVAPGEALGIIGESGSGKSTLMRCIIGDEQATDGQVFLAGFQAGRGNVLDLPPRERRKLRISTMSVVY